MNGNHPSAKEAKDHEPEFISKPVYFRAPSLIFSWGVPAPMATAAAGAAKANSRANFMKVAVVRNPRFLLTGFILLDIVRGLLLDLGLEVDRGFDLDLPFHPLAAALKIALRWAFVLPRILPLRALAMYRL